jgi:xanthine dehydrogenase iron-sulfur cluster and FAD-binding subunit A
MTEAALWNKEADAETVKAAQSALAAEIAPIDDLRSTRDYRLRVSLNLLDDFVRQVAAAVR